MNEECQSQKSIQLPLGNVASNSDNFVVLLKAGLIRSIRHYRKIELDVPRLSFYWSVT